MGGLSHAVAATILLYELTYRNRTECNLGSDSMIVRNKLVALSAPTVPWTIVRARNILCSCKKWMTRMRLGHDDVIHRYIS